MRTLPKKLTALTTGLLLAGQTSLALADSTYVYRIHLPGIQGTTQNTQLTANPASLLFGTVNVGQSVAQTFNLTNNGSAATTSLTYALPSGVTESDNCGQTLAAGASCTVTATFAPTSANTLAGSIRVASQDSNAQVAVSGTTPVTVARVYVTQVGSVPDLCNLNANGSLGTCSAVSGAASGVYSMATIGPYAYEDNGSSVAVCSIISGDALSGCSTLLTGLSTSYDLVINNGYAYLTQQVANNVEVCAIGSAGALTGCTTTGSALSNPIGISFSGNYAYIVNYNNSSITSCTVNADGTFASCSKSASVGSNPLGIAITADNSAYITGNGAAIYKCTLNGLTVSGCTAVVTSGLSASRNPSIINGVLYVPDMGGNALRAYLIGSAGALTLLNSATGLTSPWGVTPAP